MELTRNEVVALYNVLTKAKSHPTGVRFRYAVNMNLGLLKPIIEAIKESLPTNEHKDLNAYEEARKEVLKEHSDRQEGDLFHIIAGKEEIVKTALLKIDEKFSEVAKVQEEINLEINQFLADKIAVKYYSISINDIPDDVEADVQEGLHLLIVDE